MTPWWGTAPFLSLQTSRTWYTFCACIAYLLSAPSVLSLSCWAAERSSHNCRGLWSSWTGTVKEQELACSGCNIYTGWRLVWGSWLVSCAFAFDCCLENIALGHKQSFTIAAACSFREITYMAPRPECYCACRLANTLKNMQRSGQVTNVTAAGR